LVASTVPRAFHSNRDSWIGTNTDAAIIDITKTSNPTTRGVRASHKLKTTTNVTDGIEAAVRKVIADAGVDPQNGEILSLTIGTTVSSVQVTVGCATQ
jgi:ribulose kinase